MFSNRQFELFLLAIWLINVAKCRYIPSSSNDILQQQPIDQSNFNQFAIPNEFGNGFGNRNFIPSRSEFPSDNIQSNRNSGSAINWQNSFGRQQNEPFVNAQQQQWPFNVEQQSNTGRGNGYDTFQSGNNGRSSNNRQQYSNANSFYNPYNNFNPQPNRFGNNYYNNRRANPFGSGQYDGSFGDNSNPFGSGRNNQQISGQYRQPIPIDYSDYSSSESNEYDGDDIIIIIVPVPDYSDYGIGDNNSTISYYDSDETTDTNTPITITETPATSTPTTNTQTPFIVTMPVGNSANA